MGNLLDILRIGVAVADDVTKSLQATVKYERFLSADAEGTQTFAGVVKLKAISEEKQQQVRTREGILTTCRSTVLFIDIPKLLSATANKGIMDNDRITLPDGSTGPILSLGGFIDAGTGVPVATQVYLG